MKILVIIGWEDDMLAKAYCGIVPMLLQQGINKQGTSFIDHEIIVAMTDEAIGSYFENIPDRLMFLGTYADPKKLPAFISLLRMLTRNMDKRKFLFTNPIRVPPFHKEENFFVITDTDGMAAWFGLT